MDKEDVAYICISTHKWDLKKKINKKQNQNYKYREQTGGCQRGGHGVWAKWEKGKGNTALQLYNE